MIWKAKTGRLPGCDALSPAELSALVLQDRGCRPLARVAPPKEPGGVRHDWLVYDFARHHPVLITACSPREAFAVLMTLLKDAGVANLCRLDRAVEVHVWRRNARGAHLCDTIDLGPEDFTPYQKARWLRSSSISLHGKKTRRRGTE